MILKPFMLRRVKKDVENELGDKVCILKCGFEGAGMEGSCVVRATATPRA